MKKKMKKISVVTHIAYDDTEAYYEDIYNNEVEEYIRVKCDGYDSYDVSAFCDLVTIYKVTPVEFSVKVNELSITLGKTKKK